MSNIKKALLENFLEYCKKGIYINFELKDFKIPPIFIEKIGGGIKEFAIFNEFEEEKLFIIHDLEDCEIEEYEDSLIIHKGKTNIFIEEWV